MTQSTAQIEETRSSSSQCVSASPLSNDQVDKERVAREAQRDDLDESSVSTLIDFFQVLDRWDREAKRNAEIV